MWRVFLVTSLFFASLVVSSCRSAPEDSPPNPADTEPVSTQGPVVENAPLQVVQSGSTEDASESAPETSGDDSQSQLSPVISDGESNGAALTPSTGTDTPVTTTLTDSATLETGTTQPDRKGGILPSTRRNAKGLPDEISGYVVWFGLQRDETVSSPIDAHLEDSKIYVELPSDTRVSVGAQLDPPTAGTTLIREAKQSTDDFVRHLDVMRLTEDGWRYQRFERGRATQGFSSADTASCSNCHVTAAHGHSLAGRTIVE